MTTEHTDTTATAPATANRKFIIAAVMIAVAFVGSYAFAQSRGASQPNAAATAAGDSQGTQLSAAAGAPGAAGGQDAGAAGDCSCCGTGGSTEPVEGSTTVEGAVQRIAVDTSAGTFAPNVIKAKAGVPIEIDFSQAPGGCMSGVLFPDFGIDQDLTAGPRTIKLPALEKGTYAFSCQMQMVTGSLVVE